MSVIMITVKTQFRSLEVYSFSSIIKCSLLETLIRQLDCSQVAINKTNKQTIITIINSSHERNDSLSEQLIHQSGEQRK